MVAQLPTVSFPTGLPKQFSRGVFYFGRLDTISSTKIEGLGTTFVGIYLIVISL